METVMECPDAKDMSRQEVERKLMEPNNAQRTHSNETGPETPLVKQQHHPGYPAGFAPGPPEDHGPKSEGHMMNGGSCDIKFDNMPQDQLF